MSEIFNWSTVASLNTASPADGAPENTTKLGQINDIIRELQAAIARHYKDNDGTLVLIKQNDFQYGVTINSHIANYFDGLTFRAQPDHGNQGACQVSVNGLPYKQILYQDGSQLNLRELSGGTVQLVFKQWADAFFIISGRNSEAHPAVGAEMLFWATSAPLNWIQDLNLFWENRAVLTTVSVPFGNGGSWNISGLTANPEGAHTHPVNIITSGALNAASGQQSGPNPSVGESHQHLVSGTTLGGDAHSHDVVGDGSWRPLYANWIVCIRAF